MTDPIAAMREALEPFAKFAEKAEQFVNDRVADGGSPIMPTKEFRLTEFRRARAALAAYDAAAAPSRRSAPNDLLQRLHTYLCKRSDDMGGANNWEEVQLIWAIEAEQAAHAKRKEATMDKEKLRKAIEHAVNYHSLDSKLGKPDWQIADLIVDEVFKHLREETDVQIYEKMAAEERQAIGR